MQDVLTIMVKNNQLSWLDKLILIIYNYNDIIVRIISCPLSRHTSLTEKFNFICG